MKQLVSTMLALILALAVLGPSFAPVQGSSLPAGQEFLPEVRHFTAGGIEAPIVRGLPQRPERQYPIPYHRPGQPAKTSVANGARLAEAYGLSQPLTMTAALELGVQDDPLQGNYRLVDWDQMLLVGGLPASVEGWGVQAAVLITESPGLAPPSQLPQYLAEAAWPDEGAGAVVADLNGDGCDESIAIYNDLANHYCRLAAGNIGDQAGRLTSAPVVGVYYEGVTAKLLAAVRGYDGGLWVNSYTDVPLEENWVPLGGNLASAPAVAGGVDVAEVFYLDAGGDLYAVDVLVDPPVAQSLGRPPDTTLTLDPAAARWGTRTDVFVRATDNEVWHIFREGTGWSAWESLAGFTTFSPAAVWQSSDRLDLVARGFDGKLWHRYYTGHAWHPWRPVGGELASAPAVLSGGPGYLDVFALDVDGEVLHLPYAGGAWGSWESLGGELTTAPAAALFPGGIIHVLGRGPDNALWQAIRAGGSWGSWVLRGRLPRYVITELPWTCTLEFRDQAAGHFLGDGREQVLLRDGAYFRLYQADSTGGFSLQLVDSYGPVLDSFWADQGGTVGVGDYDGDGREEFAVLHTDASSTDSVRVYRVDPGTGHIAQIAQHDWSANDLNHIYSVGAGDLNGDGTDELVLASIWDYLAPFPSPTWWAVYSVDANAQDLVSLYSTTNNCSSNARCAQAVSVGNFDGAGPDELAITWLENSQISVRVLAKNANDWQFSEWDTATIDSRPASWAIRHYLHSADLDRNLRDELVLEFDDMDGGVQPGLHVLYVDGAHQVQKVQATWVWYTAYSGWTDTDIGGLTGQGLRVGPPTVRHQNDVRGIEAIISEPPKHKDVIGGVLYDINASDTGTYSEYVEDASHTEELSIQAQRHWTLDNTTSAMGSIAMNVKNSMRTTYGEHFEKTNGEFETLEMQTTARAEASDLIIYTRSDYKVYEYPFYQNESTVPAGYMTVVFQQNANGLERSWDWGSQCDFWYRPNHQNHNVWSYPDDQDGFVNMDPERGVISCGTTYNVGAGDTSFEVAWQAGQTEMLSSEVNWRIGAKHEIQVDFDSVLGFVIPRRIHFETKRPYSETRVELQKMSATEGTQVGGTLNNLPPEYQVSAAYEVNPCLYWSKAGYLALDWWARPGAGDFWANHYASTDPAFIRLYEEGQCSVLGTDFSTDVYVDPPRAAPGTVVTATALVRNFSDEVAWNVRVRFYAGDPAAGGVAIEPDACLGSALIDGDCQIDTLPDRARQEVSILFMASGAGEQRIYAVLDPDGTIDEVHEDNNKAYGRLQIAAAGYGDPGAGGAGYRNRDVAADLLPAGNTDESWKTFVYTDTQGTPTAVLVPLAALSEVTRIELRPVLSPTPPPGMMSAHHAFDLLAFQGADGSEWTTPIDLTFGGALPPALAVVHYTDSDWQPNDETDLLLKHWAGDQWEDAVCEGMAGQEVQSLAENWLVVPVCQTGSYALFTPYAPRAIIHLPLVIKMNVP